jgi:hypothetical protein
MMQIWIELQYMASIMTISSTYIVKLGIYIYSITAAEKPVFLFPLGINHEIRIPRSCISYR